MKGTMIHKDIKIKYSFLSLLLVIFIMAPQIAFAADDIERISVPKVDSVGIYSSNADSTRAYQGDSVYIQFELKDEAEVPTESLEVIFDGQACDLMSLGYGTYYAETVIDDLSPTIGMGTLEINYINDDGTKEILADKPTYGKNVFLSDKTNLIELPLEDIDFYKNGLEFMTEEELKSVPNLFDNDISTYSEVLRDGTGQSVSIVFDFKDKPVTLSRVEFLSRQDEYYSRIYAAKIEGSYDGVSWRAISNGAQTTNEWQNLNMTLDRSYRYVRISCSKVWYGNLAEIKMYSKYSRDTDIQTPKITDVSIVSEGVAKIKALPGDRVTLRFKSEEDIKYCNSILSVLMAGEQPKITKVAEKTYEASIEADGRSVVGDIEFNISCVSQEGNVVSLTDETTDGTCVFATNEDYMVGLLNGDVDFIDFRGKNHSDTFEQIYNLIDNKYETISDFSSGAKGEKSYITFDFNAEVKLSRIEILPRQEMSYRSLYETLYDTVEGLDVLGSNDGISWTSISYDKAENKRTWQAVFLNQENDYRYIKITNNNGWSGDLAELRVFKAKPDDADFKAYVNLGTGGITNPSTSLNNGFAWSGSKVSYGNKDDDSLLWRVLKKEDDDSILLFADDVVEGKGKYSHKFINTTWDTSTMRAYLNGRIYIGGVWDPGVVIDYLSNNFIGKYFSELESSSMKESYITTKESINGSPGGEDTLDKIFLLANEDVTNVEYGFVNDASRRDPRGNNTSLWWWTRSVGTNSRAYATSVSHSGGIDTHGKNIGYPYPDGLGVRPAFRVDGKSVLFTTYSDADKRKYANFGTESSAVENGDITGGKWRLTLKHTDKTLDASIIGDTEFVKGGNMALDVIYKPAAIFHKDAQVSAMLVDDNGKVLYYGKINDEIDSIRSKITLPEDLESGKYTLKIFAEVIDEESSVDYGTEFSSIDLTIRRGVPVEDINGIPNETDSETGMILDGFVMPVRATYKDIIYFIKDSGGTGAVLRGDNILIYDKPGVVTVAAVVTNGKLNGIAYYKEFTIRLGKEKIPEEVPDIPEEEIPEEPDIKPNKPVEDEEDKEEPEVPEEDKEPEQEPEIPEDEVIVKPEPEKPVEKEEIITEVEKPESGGAAKPEPFIPVPGEIVELDFSSLGKKDEPVVEDTDDKDTNTSGGAVNNSSNKAEKDDDNDLKNEEFSFGNSEIGSGSSQQSSEAYKSEESSGEKSDTVSKIDKQGNMANWIVWFELIVLLFIALIIIVSIIKKLNG